MKKKFKQMFFILCCLKTHSPIFRIHRTWSYDISHDTLFEPTIRTGASSFGTPAASCVDEMSEYGEAAAGPSLRLDARFRGVQAWVEGIDTSAIGVAPVLEQGFEELVVGDDTLTDDDPE